MKKKKKENNLDRPLLRQQRKIPVRFSKKHGDTSQGQAISCLPHLHLLTLSSQSSLLGLDWKSLSQDLSLKLCPAEKKLDEGPAPRLIRPVGLGNVSQSLAEPARTTHLIHLIHAELTCPVIFEPTFGKIQKSFHHHFLRWTDNSCFP